MRRSSSYALIACVFIAFPIAVSAQIPDKFENLEVLPKDISKPALIGTMRGMASALGVRCKYCHVGPDNLQGMDFATDKRQSKQTARRMMLMVKAINEEHLAGLETSSETTVKVECKTCHRGIAIPIQIEDVIAGVIESDGLEAAKTKYMELRDEYYGSASYDFGPRPLNSLSESLFSSGKQDAALELTRMNNELHPDYAWSRVLLAGFHKARGEKAEAIAAYDAALEIEPDNEWVKEQRDALAKE